MIDKIIKFLRAIPDLYLIQKSGFFDSIWYKNRNPDVVVSGMSLITHYYFFGGFEGRDPNPEFSSGWYLKAYLDVKTMGLNPLIHYLKYGKELGYQIQPPTFKLMKMYDYAKKNHNILFEEDSEQIYLQRPKIIGAFSGNLDEGQAISPPIYISAIKDAIVFGGSNMVLVEQENILSDELVDFASEDIGIKSSLVKFRHENKVTLVYTKESKLLIKEGILLSCDHDYNYFHWLIECLPKLAMIDELKEFKDVPLLIPKGLHQNLEDALKRVNINNRQLIYLEKGFAYKMERLIYPSALSRVLDRYQGQPIFNSDIVLSHKWVSKVVQLLKKDVPLNQKPWRKLFLTRREGLRILGNQEEVELILSDQSFEIVDLIETSLDSQIELLSQASILVAPTGAALTNMSFCQPGTKVIIFMSNHEVTNYYFWSNLGAIFNLDVTIIAGDRLFNLTNYWSVHDDYVIDTNILLDQLKMNNTDKKLSTNNIN